MNNTTYLFQAHYYILMEEEGVLFEKGGVYLI